MDIIDGLQEYKTGKKIYGDDFSIEEIEAWYADEASGYADMASEKRKNDYDEYKNITQYMLYQYLESDGMDVLSYGGGYGTELLPILGRIKQATILEPGEKFWRESIGGKTVKYVRPEPSGIMPFEDKSFDCILCLGKH